MTSTLLHPLALRPIIPAWLVVILALGLLGLAAWFLIKRPRERLDWTVRALMVVAVAGILLRPGIGESGTGSVVTDMEILVVVDRTTSMSAQDWNGSEARLEGVKRDLTELTDQFPGARFSLITFGRFTRTELPYSSDSGAFLAVVDTMSTEGAFDGAGSSVSIAHDEMLETLKRSAEKREDRQRMVVFVSDGENTSESPQESFADLEEYLAGGVVLGYGTQEGGKMPVDPERPDAGFITDTATQSDALSKLDEKNLKQIADEMGLAYLHREEPGDLGGWADDVKQSFEAADEGNQAKHELYWIFALLLFGLALVELRISWRGLVSANKELKSL